MKKSYGIGIGVLVVLLAIGLLWHMNAPKDSPNSQAVQIGVLMPFSTDFAWWGDAIRDSIKVAQANGYETNVQFVYQDTKCDPKEAISATQYLKSVYPSMHMFIVGCDSDLKAMLPLLDKNKDLAFMVGLSGEDLYQTDFPIINLAYRIENEGTVAAQFAYNVLGARRLGIIAARNNFGGTLNDSATAYFKDSGGAVFSEFLKYNDPNPETAVLKIVQDKPDVIYIHNDIPTMSAILKRLDQLGYTGKRMLYYGGRDQSLIDSAGIAAEGIYVPWAISDTTATTTQKFIDTFKTMYAKEPFITAYFVYDGLSLLQQAGTHCANDVRCIENYFYSKNGFVGTLGTVAYQKNGEVSRNLYFEQIRNGKFVQLSPTQTP